MIDFVVFLSIHFQWAPHAIVKKWTYEKIETEEYIEREFCADRNSNYGVNARNVYHAFVQ